MAAMDKGGLPDRPGGYQHSVLPRVLWPLLMYEVPVSTVERLEWKIEEMAYCPKKFLLVALGASCRC